MHPRKIQRTDSAVRLQLGPPSGKLKLNILNYQKYQGVAACLAARSRLRLKVKGQDDALGSSQEA